jgi:hypothetical protein
VTPVQRRSLSSARAGLALALALGLGACADALTGTIEPPAGASKSLAIATPSDAQAVAKGLALAMRNPSIRGQVHAAMRGSSFNEHKLVLQDFANTPPGEDVLTAVAAALGQSLGSVKSEVASLPALDFYLPFPAHRQSWKPTGDVYVATTFDKRAPSITAYGSNGQVLELRQADGVPSVPLIILHPAEPKTTSMPGNNSDSLIESPTRISTASQGSFLVDCGDTCGGGGSVSTAPPPGTYITHFNIQASDGWFGEEEMRFYSFALAGHVVFVNLGYQHNELIADYSCDKGMYSRDGVKQYLGYYGPYMISPTVTKGSFLTCNGYPAVYAVHMMEADGGFLLDDDDYGWRIWAPTYYPWGATYDVVQTYYGNTYPAENANTTAYFRITIQ